MPEGPFCQIGAHMSNYLNIGQKFRSRLCLKTFPLLALATLLFGGGTPCVANLIEGLMGRFRCNYCEFGLELQELMMLKHI